MRVTTTQYKHCDLIKISGRIDSSTAPQLADAVNMITGADRYRIVLDMNEVEFLSSAGLRVLINTQKTCRRYNRGETVIAQPSKNALAALELAGFNTLFKIYDDALTAVGSF